MRRADRLFQLVNTLHNRQFATAQQLADHLKVSKRTIYRDVQDLQRSGILIVGEAGVGYHLKHGHKLPPLTFNTEELEALVFGIRVAEAWGDDALALASRGVMTKLEAALPQKLREKMLKTRLFVPPGVSGAPATNLESLRHAISSGHKITFEYTRADGLQSKRIVSPLGLYFWGHQWSLAAWCELRVAYRTFRPDRMTTLSILKDTFVESSEGVSLTAFIALSQASTDSQKTP